ncbi:hypothetical protein ACFV06_34365 [Streptomyces sp. NPDC059618]
MLFPRVLLGRVAHLSITRRDITDAARPTLQAGGLANRLTLKAA